MAKQNSSAIMRREQDGVEFFTVQSTGESGMSLSGLAKLCGVGHDAISKLLKLVVKRCAPEFLKPLEGKALKLVPSSEYKNATILKDEVCAVILEWYAFESQRTNDTARYSYRQFAKLGIRSWIQGITEWRSQSQEQHQRLWWDRLKLFESKTKIPLGYWCVFGELGNLMRDLEAKGVILPEKSVLDISVGKCWCNYLNSLGHDTHFRKYPHQYPDHRSAQPANIYPDALLPLFREWLGITYIPGKFPAYVRRICSTGELELIAMAIGYPVLVGKA